ncbi:MAG: FAD-dependent oxidoreductase [Gammaproteobacteria bacterium]|nr:FAD-dependent oxidoreductase [Gammaproteobacteria bacterium]
MRNHAQVVVIGGGLVGCSILYHLTRLGWNDVVLLERDELTSGSTWHAAAGIHGLHDNNNISRLQYYTMKLYRELEQLTGQSCGIFQPGSLYLAQTRDREHQLRIQAAKARYFGVEFYELSTAEALEKHPLINFDGIRCVMFEPDGGNVDPSGVTHAYAQGARAQGAEIHRFTPVTATIQQPNGQWRVETPAGEILCDVLVNAAGLWAREVAAMAGVTLPLMTMEHQYFVTEDIPQIKSHPVRLPSVADRDAEYYLRQEGQGLLVGAYEKNGKLWAEHGTPRDFGHELLPDDLERMEDNLARAVERLPVLADAGVKRVINGPMIWSPDSSALMGPVPECRNYFCCTGIIPGFSQSGGLGLSLAQWIVDGEPELDLFGWDLARYDDWADKKFTRARAMDCYSNRYRIHFPYEEREAGRPVRTRPVYSQQKSSGAAFGLNSGWEHPLWFAGNSESAIDTCGFERQPWLEAVGRECRALRNDVGMIDISNFAKYEIRGHGARQWLDRIVANQVPTENGRSCLTPLLGIRGGIAGDFTITQLATDHYWMVGSGMAERYHKRYFESVPLPPGTSFHSRSSSHTGFNIAGPKSRELLQRLCNTDLSAEAFPFMRSRAITIGGIDVLALRVSFTGDLGWELYCTQEDQLNLYTLILETGKDFGLAQVGGRALLSLRLEKGYGSWGREYSPEYRPHEVGLDRLVKLDKPEFLGRDAWSRLFDTPPREKLVGLSIETSAADASGGEPVFARDGSPAGRISSGAYSFTTGQSLALAFIQPEYLSAQTLDVAILGDNRQATILSEPAFDPTGVKLRS